MGEKENNRNINAVLERVLGKGKEALWPYGLNGKSVAQSHPNRSVQVRRMRSREGERERKKGKKSERDRK